MARLFRDRKPEQIQPFTVERARYLKTGVSESASEPASKTARKSTVSKQVLPLRTPLSDVTNKQTRLLGITRKRQLEEVEIDLVEDWKPRARGRQHVVHSDSSSDDDHADLDSGVILSTESNLATAFGSTPADKLDNDSNFSENDDFDLVKDPNSNSRTRGRYIIHSD